MKAGPSLQESLRDVRNGLDEGGFDSCFSDPIDKALSMIEPFMESDTCTTR